MEEVYLRFPHLSEDIYGSLSSESLAKCKEVSKYWYQYLDDQKFVEKRANKVKLLIETVKKFGQIQDYHTQENPFDKKTRKTIIEDARNGKFLLVHVRIMVNLDRLYAPGQPFLAAASAGHFEVVKYLVDNQFDKNPNTYGSSRETPLHCAARDDKLDVVKYIMSNVSDMNPKDKFGQTPLHYAARRGNLDVVKYIMDKVEDKSPIDSNGNIPFHMAAISGQSCVYKYIKERLEADNTPLALADRQRGSKMLMVAAKRSRNFNGCGRRN